MLLYIRFYCFLSYLRNYSIQNHIISEFYPSKTKHEHYKLQQTYIEVIYRQLVLQRAPQGPTFVVCNRQLVLAEVILVHFSLLGFQMLFIVTEFRQDRSSSYFLQNTSRYIKRKGKIVSQIKTTQLDFTSQVNADHP